MKNYSLKSIIALFAMTAPLSMQAGDGTYANPYTVSEMVASGTTLLNTNVWMKGYIIAAMKSSTSGWSLATTPLPQDPSTYNNSIIEIADSPSETDATKCAGISIGDASSDEMPSIKDKTNLVDNPTSLGKEIKAYGTIASYYKVPGIKTAYFAVFGGISLYNPKIHKSDVSTLVTVVPTLALDEATSFSNPATAKNFEMVNTCTLTRTFGEPNNWSAICLPFGLTAEQITEAFGNDVKIAELTKYEGNNVNFDMTTKGMKANTPYLISNISKSNFSFSNIFFEESTNVTITVGNSDNSASVSAIGNYDAAKSIESDKYYISNGKLVLNEAGSQKINAFGAYFSLTNANGAKTVGITINGVSTKVNGITDTTAASKDIYDINGRKISQDAITSGQLEKGIYICNGKKIIYQ